MAKRALTVTYAGLSEKGPIREENQDGFLAADLRAPGSGARAESGVWTLDKGRLLLAIADGMGGGPAGREAAQTALETLRGELARAGSAGRCEGLLRSAIEAADRSIHERAASDPALKGMGTTLTAAVIEKDGAYIGHVGDTRAYLARGGRLTALTTDHTLLGKVMGLPPEQARLHIFKNVLSQCVGGGDSGVAVELTRLRLRPGDTLLLSTDGLHGAVSDAALAAALSDTRDLLAACRRLVVLALEAETQDNVTAVLARFEGGALSGGGDEAGDIAPLEEVFFDREQGRMSSRRPVPAAAAPADPAPAVPQEPPEERAPEVPGEQLRWLPATAGIVLAIYSLVACAALLRSFPEGPAEVPAPRRAARTARKPSAPAVQPASQASLPAARPAPRFRSRPVPAEAEEPAILLRRSRTPSKTP